jgi:transketolase
MTIKEEILRHSYKNGLTHIMSAMSHANYIEELFTRKLVVPYRDKIVIGKVFGAQAYYLVWKKLGYLDDYPGTCLPFVTHEEIPFVDFAEYTLGNGLGVAAGIALTTNKLVWVNLSDAVLQMGNTLEAIQFIGHQGLKNMLVTIDMNGAQVTGQTEDICPCEPVVDFFKGYNWDVQYDLANFEIGDRPKIFIMRSKKGEGVKSIEEDLRTWHYGKIQSYEQLETFVSELRAWESSQ